MNALASPRTSSAAELFRTASRAATQAAVDMKAHGPSDAVSLSTSYKRAVVEHAEAPHFDSAEGARASALSALHAGLMCGALDGLVILVAGHVVIDPALGQQSALKGSCDLLSSAMSRGREVACHEWTGMPGDDMQLLAGFGKHENLKTAEEAEALVGHADVETGAWLLATFKAGYAIGLADAVLVASGQQPDVIA